VKRAHLRVAGIVLPVLDANHGVVWEAALARDTRQITLASLQFSDHFGEWVGMFHSSNLGAFALGVKTNMPSLSADHPAVTSPSYSLTVLADNLQRLMDHHIKRKLELVSQSAIGRAASIDQKTVHRILNRVHEPSASVIGRLAKAFKLQPWQMLTPNLDPEDLPVVLTSGELRMYEELREQVTKNTSNSVSVLQRLKDLANHRVPPLQADFDARDRSEGSS